MSQRHTRLRLDLIPAFTLPYAVAGPAKSRSDSSPEGAWMSSLYVPVIRSHCTPQLLYNQLCCCRSNKGKHRFKPRGPLDVVALCACGVVALYARGTEACGNAVDEAILGTPLGQHSRDLPSEPPVFNHHQNVLLPVCCRWSCRHAHQKSKPHSMCWYWLEKSKNTCF